VQRLGVLGLAVIALLVGFATPAKAGPYVVISVGPTAVAAGDTVRISGSVPEEACASGRGPVLTTSSERLFPPDGLGPAFALGLFSVEYTVPAETPAGSYSIGLRCGGESLGMSAQLRVTGHVATRRDASISVNPTMVAAGDTVRIRGSVPYSVCTDDAGPRLTSVDRLFPPDGLGPAAARDPSGAFSVSYTVPAQTPAGTYQIGLRCGGGNVGVSARLQVTEQVTTVPSGGVDTGAGGSAEAGSRQWTLLGLGFLTLAAALLPVRRRLVHRRR
jgi:hypothetical protein